MNATLHDTGHHNSLGIINDVRSSAVEVHLHQEVDIALFDVLRVPDGSESGQELGVVSRPSPLTLICVALSDSPALTVGQGVFATGRRFSRDLGEDALTRAITSLNRRPAWSSAVQETGIKAIDFLCPLSTSGTIGVLGGPGVAGTILAGELLHRFPDASAGWMFHFLTARSDLDMVQAARPAEAESIGEYDRSGANTLTWLPTDFANDPVFALETAPRLFDSTVFLSPIYSVRGLYPAVDPLYSSSRLMKPDIVGRDHFRVWQQYSTALARTRELMTDTRFLELLAYRARRRAVSQFHTAETEHLGRLNPADATLVSRVRKTERFLTQPFHIAAPYTGMAGVSVRRADTVATVEAILHGAFDSQDERTFSYIALPQ